MDFFQGQVLGPLQPTVARTHTHVYIHWLFILFFRWENREVKYFVQVYLFLNVHLYLFMWRVPESAKHSMQIISNIYWKISMSHHWLFITFSEEETERLNRRCIFFHSLWVLELEPKLVLLTTALYWLLTRHQTHAHTMVPLPSELRTALKFRS